MTAVAGFIAGIIAYRLIRLYGWRAGYAEGYADGWAEGYAKGRSDGYADGWCDAPGVEVVEVRSGFGVEQGAN